MMFRSSSSLSLLTLALTSVALGGCLSPGVQPTTDSETATESGSTSSSSTDTISPTTDSETEGTTEVTMTTMTTTSSGVCGDGNVDGGEECDDGANNGDDAACTSACLNNVCGDGKLNTGVEECDDGNSEDGDGCTTECKNNVCGDGFVYDGVEVCDDGVNDNSYDGCNEDCSAKGPGCGDGILQAEEGEVCDSQEEFIGCLDNCQQAQSCLEIKTDDDAAVSGVYVISPDGYEGTLDVYCDMETDGGGYTFLKVSENNTMTAVAAEVVCDAYSMNLFVPRTAGHLASAWVIATTDNVLPLGSDGVSDSVDYVTMLGIYPAVVGESCPGVPLNSDDCPEWVATDGGAFFISGESYEDEPSINNCAGCSMEYGYDDQGTLIGYAAQSFNGGYKSSKIFCDVGDKMR